jgi:DNA-binding NarL/FixJ family response regulator
MEISEREQEVFELLLEGKTNRQIAAHLCICEKTVEKHLTNIYAKVGVASRTEAILWGIERSRDFPT